MIAKSKKERFRSLQMPCWQSLTLMLPMTFDCVVVSCCRILFLQLLATHRQHRKQAVTYFRRTILNHNFQESMGAAASTNSYYYELMAELEKRPSPPLSLTLSDGRQEVIRMREIIRGAYEESISRHRGTHHDASMVASKSTGFSHYYRGSTALEQTRLSLRAEGEAEQADEGTARDTPALKTLQNTPLSRAASGSVLAGHGVPSDVRPFIFIFHGNRPHSYSYICIFTARMLPSSHFPLSPNSSTQQVHFERLLVITPTPGRRIGISL